jgi:hypothetical protein
VGKGRVGSDGQQAVLSKDRNEPDRIFSLGVMGAMMGAKCSLADWGAMRMLCVHPRDASVWVNVALYYCPGPHKSWPTDVSPWRFHLNPRGVKNLVLRRPRLFPPLAQDPLSAMWQALGFSCCLAGWESNDVCYVPIGVEWDVSRKRYFRCSSGRFGRHRSVPYGGRLEMRP